MSPSKLTKISMVDISTKLPLKRIAIAEGKIHLQEKTIDLIRNNKIKKGDPIAVAQVAAIAAIKLTPQLIPLCHQIPITNIQFKTEFEPTFLKVQVTVESIAQTGVEMESLIGVSIFLNNIWDMTKYLEKDNTGQYPSTIITDINVLSKEKHQK